jgi:hypothetical protein
MIKAVISNPILFKPPILSGSAAFLFPKPSCVVQRPFRRSGNLPAWCSDLSGVPETFLRGAATFPVFRKTFLRGAATFPAFRKPSCAVQRPFRCSGKPSCVVQQPFRRSGNLPA